MAQDRDTQRLREEQRSREKAEEKLARVVPEEAAQHRRRAEKSRYLRRKLEERAASEREADRS
jgi:hypothetical protein